MPTNSFGSDFFDQVLGTASSNLKGFMQTLPNFPDANPVVSPAFDGLNITPPAFFEYALGEGTDLSGMDYSAGITANPFTNLFSSPLQKPNATQGQQPMTRWQQIQAQHQRPQTANTSGGGGGQLAVPAGGEYVDYARKVAASYGIDPEVFVRQITQESNWNPQARSPVGAAGIAQFMPGTAAQYGVDVNDPYSSLDGAARHMRDLVRQYNGDYRLALAAYNAGPGNVEKYGGVPPFEETQNYIRIILGR